jgi:hypothetical protein
MACHRIQRQARELVRNMRAQSTERGVETQTRASVAKGSTPILDGDESAEEGETEALKGPGEKQEEQEAEQFKREGKLARGKRAVPDQKC